MTGKFNTKLFCADDELPQSNFMIRFNVILLLFQQISVEMSLSLYLCVCVSLCVCVCVRAAPSPVSVIRKGHTEKSSIALSWAEPDRPNGIILEYEIKYFEKVQNIFIDLLHILYMQVHSQLTKL